MAPVIDITKTFALGRFGWGKAHLFGILANEMSIHKSLSNSILGHPIKNSLDRFSKIWRIVEQEEGRTEQRFNETQHNNRHKDSQMKSNTATVGRPSSHVKIPYRKFTFNDLCVLNENLAPLTLRNFMKRDKELGKHSQIVRIDEERGEPGSEAGFGRKPFLYVRREYLDKLSGKVTPQTKRLHMTKSSAPSHQMKRREIQPSEPHQHKIINLSPELKKATSVTVSIAPPTEGLPVPTEVIIHFNTLNKEPEVKVTTTGHEIAPEAPTESATVAQEPVVEAPQVEAPTTAPVTTETPSDGAQRESDGLKEVSLPPKPQGKKNGKSKTTQPQAETPAAPSTDAPQSTPAVAKAA